MHELAVVQSMLEVVLEHARAAEAQKVQVIGLKIGALRDLVDTWIQSYFDYLSKDTLAAGAILRIERLPVVFQCEACRGSFPVKMEEVEGIACPHCGDRNVKLISGREFTIDHLEVI
jgi:hydrogenase nickel incorporation protein HypA/HybF